MMIFSLMGEILLNTGNVGSKLAAVDEQAAATAAAMDGIGLAGTEAGAKAAGGMTEAAGASEKAGIAAREAGVGFKEAAGGILESLGPLALMFGAVMGGEEIIKAGKEETDQYAAAHAQLANQLKVSKDAIGLNIKELEDLAEATGKNNAISKSANLTAISTLLNYNSISKEALPNATKAVDDLATKIAVSKGQAVPSLTQIAMAAKMVGKAMEDPATGTTAFTKAMITFSPVQVEAIKNMQKAGDTAGAQKLLMQDLAAQVSGASTAAVSTYQGKVAVLKRTMDEWSGAIVTGVEHALTNLGTTIDNVTSFIEKHKIALDAVKVVVGLLGVAVGIETGFWLANTIKVAANTMAKGINEFATHASTIAHGVQVIALGAVTIATNIATIATTAFGVAMDIATGPIGLVIAAIALVAGGLYELGKNCKPVGDLFASMWKKIGEGWAAVKKFFGFKNIVDTDKLSSDAKKAGENTGDSFAAGIAEKAAAAKAAAVALTAKVVTAMDTLGTAVTTALKNQYTKEESIMEASLDKQVEKLKSATDTKIAQYDRELAAKLKVLDADTDKKANGLQGQIDALNNQTTAEEKALTEQEYQKSLAEKKKALIAATSADEQATIQDDLNTLIADHEREAVKESRDLQINALQKKIDTIKNSNDKEKAALEASYADKKTQEQASYDAEVKSLDAIRKANEDHFAILNSDENLAAKARLLILSNNQAEMVKLLQTYNPQWQNAGQSLGDSLAKGLNSSKANIASAVKTLLSVGKLSVNSVSSYAVGTNYVPNDGLAYLHKGEAVVPAKYNAGNATQTVNHTGVITVKGVNDKGQTQAVVDIIMGQLRQEMRMA
jgi:hypothetical protein